MYKLTKTWGGDLRQAKSGVDEVTSDHLKDDVCGRQGKPNTKGMDPAERLPQREIMEETLRQKKVDDDAVAKYPITNALFKTIRQFCEDEEIKEFDQLENILITGGGANIS